MAEQTPRDDENDELLRRADALLARHRAARSDPAGASEAPVLGEAQAPAATDDDIPTLTEVIPAGEVPAVFAPSRPAASGPSGGEVISRVQAQNLEHSLYQKLKRDLDQHIAQVMQD